MEKNTHSRNCSSVSSRTNVMEKTKLIEELRAKIEKLEKEKGGRSYPALIDIAISNLYIALSNLMS